jgi:hypothetical protein
MASTRRRLAVGTATVLGGLVLLLVLVPLLFRDRLENALKAQIGSGVEAHVDWSGVGASLLRDFPNLTLRVDDLVVSGRGPFAGDTLASVPGTRLVLDLGSVVRGLRGRGAFEVRSIELREPRIRLLVLEDGTANWDLGDRTVADPDAAPRPFNLTLHSFTVSDGSLVLDNRATGLRASVSGLAQSLRGDFAESRFTARTDATADSVSVHFAGVPYLNRVRLDVRADVAVDAEARRVEVRDNRVRLNALVLELSGSAEQRGDGLRLDLAFSAPGTDFAEILSLVPAVFARDFDAIRTTGRMAVSGWVRGDYGPDAFPAFALDARVQDGTVRYPDLPLPARDVALDLSLTNPGGDVDRTILDVGRFHVVLGDDPIDGSFRMATPVSDPDLEAAVTGRLDLANLARTFRLETVEELAGVVTAEAAVRARLSDLDAGRYERVAAEGTIGVAGLILRAIDLPHPLLVEEARLRLSPRHAELSAFRGSVGSSDLTLTGRLDNLLGFILLDEELRGEARMTSRHLALDEWRSEDDARAVPVPARIDFSLDATIDRITFAELDMRDATGRFHVRDQRLSMEDFRLRTLGGTMTLTGYYETLDPARPTFDMDLRLAEVDVPSAYAGLGTMQAFAPVARYAVGQLTAELRLNGVLGADLVPRHEVLSGLGSFRTAGLRLQDFPPLDRLADALQLPLLSDPGLIDVSSTLVIRDGRLHVSPFDVTIGDMVLNVAGSNGLDQSLDFNLGLQLPRSTLGAGADQVVATLISRTERGGIELRPSDVISLGARLTGNVTSPALSIDFRGFTSSAAQGVQQALQQEAERRVEAVERQLDAAADEARGRARAEAERLLAEAEESAATIREEARALASAIRREGDVQADALLNRATNPAARLAARPAADRLRQEAADRADRLVAEADARADALIAEARTRLEAAREP